MPVSRETLNREATAPTQDLGGTTGLTVVGWVRRANQGSAFDRIIDFGNDAPSKGNIVINFQGFASRTRATTTSAASS